jgi:hypothetical protein
VSLQEIALYLAALLAGGAPAAERTLVVCDKDDEPATVAWTKARFGASATVLALRGTDEFVAKVSRARTQGAPATRIVIHPRHFTSDPEDGELKLGLTEQDLVGLVVPGFKRMEFASRMKTLIPLLEIADTWRLNEIVGWTQRFFTGMQPIDLDPARPTTADQRKNAAVHLLFKLSRIPIDNHDLGQFSALPHEPDPLAEALKGAGAKFNVPFEWFGGDFQAVLDIARQQYGVNTPVANASPQDITLTIERGKIGAVLQQASSPRDDAPADIKTMAAAAGKIYSVEGVIQRMVITIT